MDKRSCTTWKILECAKKHSVCKKALCNCKYWFGFISIPIWRFDIFLNGVATSPPWFEIDYDHGCENNYVVGGQKSGYCNQLTWIFHILVWNGAPTNSLEKRCILIALLRGTNPKQCWQYLETETSIFLVAITLPETNGSHLKMDDWKTRFLLGRTIFRGYVSFREGICFQVFLWEIVVSANHPLKFVSLEFQDWIVWVE